MKSDKEIADQFKRHKGVSERGLAHQLANSEKCHAYYEADFLDKSKFNRRPVQIDKVSPYVRAVNGFMIQNRPSSNYAARIQDEQRQEAFTKSANAVAWYIKKNARADQVKSQATRTNLIQGYASVETAMTYSEGYATTDPNGEVIMGEVSALWDPMARKTNLTDSRWAFYPKSYDKEDAEKLFSDYDDDDLETVKEDTGEFKFDPNIYPYDRSKIDDAGYEWNSEKDKTIWVNFYQWYETENFYRAENPVYKIQNPVIARLMMAFMEDIAAQAEADDSMFKFDPTATRLVFDGAVKAKLEEKFEDLIKCYKFPRKVFYSAVLSGRKVFTKYRSVSQQGFTIKFMTGDWHAKSRMWVGMVNPMMEPVLFYNKALEALMYTIDANSKGGLLYEEDATDDPTALEANYNKTDKSIKLNSGGLAKVREKRSPFQPTGYENVIQLSSQAVSDTMGFDLAAILSSDGQQSGVLHRQLVKQVKSTLAAYFDAQQSFEEDHSRLLLDLMRVYAENNEGAIIRILGPDNAQEFMEISKDPFFAEYDVEIVEAPDSDEQKMEQAQILISMGDKLVALGDPTGKTFYAGAIKVLPLDSTQRQEMLEALQGGDDPRIAQMAEQIQQLTSEQTKAQLALVNAQITNLQSSTDKNMAGVHKTAADIAQVIEDTERTSMENRIIPLTLPENVRVSI